MLSIQSSQNFNKNSRPNFKSHIVETDLYQKGLQFAKNNMHPNKDMKKGIEFVKAAEGIRNDKKYDFIGFYKSRNNVYTKINGKIDEKYTFQSTKNSGLDAYNAIMNYAKQNNSYSNKPLSESEKKVAKIQKELEKAQKDMCADYRFKINRM